MPGTNERRYEISDADLANLNATQFGVETTSDSDCGFKMWGGKDADGNLTRWLAKDEDIKVDDIYMTFTTGTSKLYGDATDADTYFDFQSDKIQIVTGGVTAINITEADPDTITLGMDLVMNGKEIQAGGSNDLVIQGGDNAAANKLIFEDSDGTDQFSVDTDGGMLVNIAGNDADSRISGDNNTNLFYVDAGNDRVAVGTNAPTYLFEVNANAPIAGIVAGANQSASLRLRNDNGHWDLNCQTDDDFAIVDQDVSTVPFVIKKGAVTDAFTIAASGNVGIGVTPTEQLHSAGGVAGTGLKILNHHTDNTNGTSDSTLQLQVGGTSGGDPKSVFVIPGGSTWGVGVDNSAGDAFKIDMSGTVGADTVFEATNTNITINPGGGARDTNFYGTTLIAQIDYTGDHLEIRDDKQIVFGNTHNWAMRYDETTDNALEIVELGNEATDAAKLIIDGSGASQGCTIDIKFGTTGMSGGLAVYHDASTVSAYVTDRGLQSEGVVYMKERAAANGDDGLYGQFWVKNDNPNIPYYTDGDSTDKKIMMEDVAWTDYSGSSTINGWSGSPTAAIRYKKVGTTVFVAFSVNGTSNSTVANFTLPYASANTGVSFGGAMDLAVDNGSNLTAASRFTLGANSSTVNCYTNMATSAWTASNNKQVNGHFCYETT